MDKKLLKRAYPGKKEKLSSRDVKINQCLVNNSYPTDDFLNTLKNDELIRIASVFKLFCDKNGKLHNKEKFKMFDRIFSEAIFEFKEYRVRLAGFWRPENNFNLIHGFKKKDRKWPKKEVNLLKRNFKNFQQEEKNRLK